MNPQWCPSARQWLRPLTPPCFCPFLKMWTVQLNISFNKNLNLGCCCFLLQQAVNHRAKYTLWRRTSIEYLPNAWWRVPGRARPVRPIFSHAWMETVTNWKLDKARHWRNSLLMKSLVEATPGGLRPRRWKAGGSSFTRTACVIWDSAVKFTDDGPFFFWTQITNGVQAASCEVPTTERNQRACRRFHHRLMGSPGSHGAHKAGARSSDQYGKAKFTPTNQLEMNSWIIYQ